MNARRILLAVLCVCGAMVGCAAASDVIPTPATGPAPTARPASGQRDHVYVFLVNGLDPFFFCQFNKMPDYVRSLGYDHVSIGQMTAKDKFLDDIRRIHAADPSARIVLLGFSCGANTVCAMSHTLKDEGCPVDRLIYLGGCWIFNNASSRPENATKIVNIRDSGLVSLTGGLLRGDNLDGAKNVQIPGVTLHVLTPINTVTQETLARELDAVAASVPLPAATAAARPASVSIRR